MFGLAVAQPFLGFDITAGVCNNKASAIN